MVKRSNVASVFGRAPSRLGECPFCWRVRSVATGKTPDVIRVAQSTPHGEPRIHCRNARSRGKTRARALGTHVEQASPTDIPHV
jgi:hypothetical protein